MLERIEREKLDLKFILLTHAHPDHIEDLDRLRKKTGAPVFISERESRRAQNLLPKENDLRRGTLKSKRD